MMKNEKISTLYIHEWLVVAVLTGFIGMLAACAYLAAPSPFLQTESPLKLLDERIEVFVIGHVEHPGTYEMAKGSRLEDLFLQAKPYPDADLRRKNLKAKLKNSQVIKILPQKQSIRVKKLQKS